MKRSTSLALAATVGLASMASLAVGIQILRQAPHGSAWAFITGGTAGVFVTIGWFIHGTWKGIFVNRRNRWSLSQTQTVLWSILVIATFLTYYVLRVASDVADPMNIGVQKELAYLMGLSAAGLGGAALLQSQKGRAPMHPEEWDSYRLTDLRWNFRRRTREYWRDRGSKPSLEGRNSLQSLRWDLEATDLRRRPTSMKDLRAGADGEGERFLAWLEKYQTRSRPVGRLVRNLEPTQAQFSDMLRAEEVGNAYRADLGKIQLFLIGLVTMVAFAFAAIEPLGGENLCVPPASGCVDALPALSGGFAGILLASTGAYLFTKGAGHPPEYWSPKVDGSAGAQRKPPVPQAMEDLAAAPAPRRRAVRRSTGS